MPNLVRLCPLVALCTLGCPPPYDDVYPQKATDSTGESSTSSSSTADASTTDESPTTTGTTTNPTTGDGADSTTGTSSTTTDGTTDPEAPPAAPTLTLGYAAIKKFKFMWDPVPGAEYYQVLEKPDADSPEWTVLADDLTQSTHWSRMPLHFRADASYKLRACNDNGCSESEPVGVGDGINSAIGYFKASNAGVDDFFGNDVAISADGNTMVVTAHSEASGADGINGEQFDNSSPSSGAAYVFVRTGTVWSQQAYLKASNSEGQDYFSVVTISADGNTIAVGASGEDSAATGVDGDESDNSAMSAGAVYVFAREAGVWTQQAYIKAINTETGNNFGGTLALAADGDTLAVGSASENNASKGIDGSPWNGDADNSGAVYVYARDGHEWAFRTYFKASNADASDEFGRAVALSGDGQTLAVGAPYERGASPGINGDQLDNSSMSGAVYVFALEDGAWAQQAYVKSYHPDSTDLFGNSVALSSDGNTLAIGSFGESSASTEIDGDQTNNDAPFAGAVYIYSRSGATWEQEAYIKAPNAKADDRFGYEVALAANGDTLAVGAFWEGGGGTGVLGDLFNQSLSLAGATYVFTRTGGTWTHKSYIKASNPVVGGWFGKAVGLSGDGLTLVVGAPCDESLSTGIGGDQHNPSNSSVGAIYMY